MQMIEYRPADVGGMVDVARLIQQAKMNAFNRNLAKVEAGHKYDDADMFAQGAEGLTGKKYNTSSAPAYEIPTRDTTSPAGQMAGLDANAQADLARRRATTEAFRSLVGLDKADKLGQTLGVGAPAMQYNQKEIDDWNRLMGRPVVTERKMTGAELGNWLQAAPSSQREAYAMRREAPTVSVVTHPDEAKDTKRSEDILRFMTDQRYGTARKQVGSEVADARRQVEDKYTRDLENAANSISRVDADSSPLNYRRYANKVNAVIDWEGKAMARASSDSERAAIRDRANRMLEATKQQFGYLHRTFQDENRNPYADRAKRGGGSGFPEYKYAVVHPDGTEEPMTVAELARLKASKAYRENPRLWRVARMEASSKEGIAGRQIKNEADLSYLDDEARERLSKGGTSSPAGQYGNVRFE